MLGGRQYAYARAYIQAWGKRIGHGGIEPRIPAETNHGGDPEISDCMNMWRGYQLCADSLRGDLPELNLLEATSKVLLPALEVVQDVCSRALGRNEVYPDLDVGEMWDHSFDLGALTGGPRVRGTNGQHAKYGLANSPAAVGTAADIEAGGTVGTGNGVPSVVRVGAEVEVLRRCAERFVAPVPDDEPGRDGAMLQRPRVAVCGRRDEGVTASSLKTAVATTAVRSAVNGAQPPAVALVVDRRTFRATAVIQRASVRRPRRPLSLRGLTERTSRGPTVRPEYARNRQ